MAYPVILAAGSRVESLYVLTPPISDLCEFFGLLLSVLP